MSPAATSVTMSAAAAANSANFHSLYDHLSSTQQVPPLPPPPTSINVPCSTTANADSREVHFSHSNGSLHHQQTAILDFSSAVASQQQMCNSSTGHGFPSGAPQGPLPPPPPSASPQDEEDESPAAAVGPLLPAPPSPRPASAGAAAYLALEAGPSVYGTNRGLGCGLSHNYNEKPSSSSSGAGAPPPPRAATPMHAHGGGSGRHSKRQGVNLRKQHSVGCAQECFDQSFRPNFVG